MNQELKNKIKILSENFHHIRTPDVYQQLCEETSKYLSEVSSLRKEQEKIQEEACKPFREALKAEQEKHTGAYSELVGYELLLKELLSEVIKDSVDLQGQLFALQKIAQQEGDMSKVSELAQQCAKAAITLPKGVYTRQVPDVEIEDLSKIPAEFLKANKAKIIDFLETHEEGLPGVKLTSRISIGTREDK